MLFLASCSAIIIVPCACPDDSGVETHFNCSNKDEQIQPTSHFLILSSTSLLAGANGGKLIAIVKWVGDAKKICRTRVHRVEPGVNLQQAMPNELNDGLQNILPFYMFIVPHTGKLTKHSTVIFKLQFVNIQQFDICLSYFSINGKHRTAFGACRFIGFVLIR
jgi:hypothetical protein